MKQHAPATARNREPIRDVLARELPARGVVLEVASGSGEHVVAFATAFPDLTWQPSDPDPTALASIQAWRDEAALANLAAPLALDVMGTWPIEHADAIICINMVHIAPWEATIALFTNAGRMLARNALLYLYGPYRIDGVFTAPSNAAFDRSLRDRDERWGVRDIADLEAVGETAGFRLGDPIAMPANNYSLVFRRG